MPKFIDITGNRYGKLTVINRSADHITPSGNRFTMWECTCDCGNTTVAYGNALKSGRMSSCGCSQYLHSSDTARKNFSTHRHSNERLYKIWAGMIKRCENPNHIGYHNYGGRGISVCDEWRHDYMAFRTWSYANGYSDDLSIDRIDGNLGYSQDNCRWANKKTQNNNRRSNVYIEHDGLRLSRAEWADRLNVTYSFLRKRLDKGQSLSDIIQYLYSNS